MSGKTNDGKVAAWAKAYRQHRQTGSTVQTSLRKAYDDLVDDILHKQMLPKVQAALNLEGETRLLRYTKNR